MGKSYRVGAGQRAANAVFRRLAAWGRGPKYLHVLTVIGRTSGRNRSVPVDVMDIGGTNYLVAPYGQVNWVLNLRAAGTATLRRGSDTRDYDATEITPLDAIPVIREYVRSVPVTKNYWNIDNSSNDDDVMADARAHPVFELTARPARPA